MIKISIKSKKEISMEKSISIGDIVYLMLCPEGITPWVNQTGIIFMPTLKRGLVFFFLYVTLNETFSVIHFYEIFVYSIKSDTNIN